jgi:mRNA interferase MazF
METGEIYIVDFPLSDGHEQEGTRPAVIIIDFPDVPITQIVPLTSNEKAKRYKNIIVVEPDDENNIEKTSIIMLFQLRAIDKRRLINKIGRLKDIDIERLKEGLKEMYNL